MLKLKAKDSDEAKRADVFMAENLPDFSRSALKGLFTKNFATVDNKAIKASHRLNSGEIIEVNTSLLEAVPEQIDVPVIYEDEDVVVMNKPAGLLTHSKGILNTEPTVASFIKNKLNGPQLGGNRAGIVHRLDRGTSGVIITAKNEKALKWLQKQFSTRKVKKIYLAIIEGIPSPREAIIDSPIERNPKRPQTFRVGGGGKPSQTKYKVLRILNPTQKYLTSQVFLDGASKSYSLLELNPRTGRTHQLRVHLKYIGHPIVGDRVYGHGGENMYLHAKSLEITLPGGRQMKFEVPEPKIFRDFK